MKRAALAILAIAVVLFCSVPALAATGIILADTLNVRSGPGTGYVVIGKLAEGTRVDVFGQNAAGDWLYVCCTSDKHSGWVARRFVAQSFSMNVPVVDRNGYPPVTISPLFAPESPVGAPRGARMLSPLPEPPAGKARVYLPVVGAQ